MPFPMKPEQDFEESTAPEKRSESRRGVVAIVFGLVVAGVLASCVSVNRVVMMPPQIPGATYVGSETCSQCHEKISTRFVTATHANLKAEGATASNVGCESCHGPGSLHAESGGAYHTIINPKKSPETCFQCHLDKRGEFHLPHSHPVLAGQMSCGDCHDPHGGPAIRGGGTALLSQNESCLECHAAQRGPHVFEHEAMREGCILCHKPHGSVNPKMLAQRNANLCLKCHFQEIGSGITIGGFPHGANLQRGTCWTSGCHEAVHGSQVSTSLRF